MRAECECAVCRMRTFGVCCAWVSLFLVIGGFNVPCTLQWTLALASGFRFFKSQSSSLFKFWILIVLVVYFQFSISIQIPDK